MVRTATTRYIPSGVYSAAAINTPVSTFQRVLKVFFRVTYVAANNVQMVRKLNIMFGVPSWTRKRNCVQVVARIVVRTATLRRNHVRISRKIPSDVRTPSTMDGNLMLSVVTPKARNDNRCKM